MIRKYRIYLRLTKSGLVRVTRSPNYNPLPDYKYSNPKPTLAFALDLEIDDKDFEQARILLEQKINNPKPCINIKEVEEENDSKT